LDLSLYAGKEVEILFSTDPGPSGNNAWDWGGWAKLNFVPRDGAEKIAGSSFSEIYDKEVYIYEVPGVLPRASLFRAVEVLPEGDILARLKDPAFNPEEKVILSRESISKDDAAVRSLIEAPAIASLAAHISLYESQHVRIEAEAGAPTVLMLNDANYPGWRATVNGKPAAILDADYLFRGVILPAGKSVVEFSYEPASFRLGVVISTGALGVMAAAAILALQRRRRAVSTAVYETTAPS
jgi:hypothetical protein